MMKISELWTLFYAHAQVYYRKKNGRPTGEHNNLRHAFAHVLELFPDLPCQDFGPKKLKAVRDLMMSQGLPKRPNKSERSNGLCRSVINARINRIKRVFSWAVEEELISSEVIAGLRTVRALAEGRSQAREKDGVQPICWSVVERTLPELPPVVRDMVLLQWHTGMRPGEVYRLKPAHIDRSKAVWEYKPPEHKNEHRRKERVIPIGPRGQAVLKPYLMRMPDTLCFTLPRMRSDSPGAYTKNSYAKAIARACKAAGVEHWYPLQIRHSTATRLEAEMSLEDARVVLGHSHASTTRIYARQDVERARQAMALLG
jgi:integrase